MEPVADTSQKTDVKSPISVNKEQETIENGVVVSENKQAMIPHNDNTFIRKKWTYQKFKRLIKRGSYTSARMTAKILGVDKRTILEWENRKEIQELLRMDVEHFVSRIKKAKDWKASAYLLDKIEDKDNNINTTVNILEGLTIVRK